MLWPSSSSVNADQMRVCSSRGELSAMGSLQRKLQIKTHCSMNAVLAWLGAGPRAWGKHRLEVAFKPVSGCLAYCLCTSERLSPKYGDRKEMTDPTDTKLGSLHSAFGPQTGTNQDYPPGLCISAREKICVCLCLCVCIYVYVYVNIIYIKSVSEIRSHSFQHYFHKYSKLNCLQETFKVPPPKVKWV